MFEARTGRVLPGFTLVLTSTLPSGVGLSSSAAVQLATPAVICAWQDHLMAPLAAADAARAAENQCAKMPCGILDRGVSVHSTTAEAVHAPFNVAPSPPPVAGPIGSTHTATFP